VAFFVKGAEGIRRCKAPPQAPRGARPRQSPGHRQVRRATSATGLHGQLRRAILRSPTEAFGCQPNLGCDPEFLEVAGASIWL
jgi:hypothetical protein